MNQFLGVRWLRLAMSDAVETASDGRTTRQTAQFSENRESSNFYRNRIYF
jgi:hypothetical protein